MYLFILRERECAHALVPGRGRERERERIPSWLRTFSPEPDAGLDPTNRETTP